MSTILEGNYIPGDNVIAVEWDDGTGMKFECPPCPSSYQWQQEDLSANNAGRNAEYVMQKKTACVIVKIDLKWNYPTIADASKIIKMFTSKEYFRVRYLDAQEGKIVQSEFYVGNRNTPMYNGKVGRWESVSFNIIERQGKRVNLKEGETP